MDKERGLMHRREVVVGLLASIGLLSMGSKLDVKIGVGGPSEQWWRYREHLSGLEFEGEMDPKMWQMLEMSGLKHILEINWGHGCNTRSGVEEVLETAKQDFGNPKRVHMMEIDVVDGYVGHDLGQVEKLASSGELMTIQEVVKMIAESGLVGVKFDVKDQKSLDELKMLIGMGGAFNLSHVPGVMINADVISLDGTEVVFEPDEVATWGEIFPDATVAFGLKHSGWHADYDAEAVEKMAGFVERFGDNQSIQFAFAAEVLDDPKLMRLVDERLIANNPYRTVLIFLRKFQSRRSYLRRVAEYGWIDTMMVDC